MSPASHSLVYGQVTKSALSRSRGGNPAEERGPEERPHAWPGRSGGKERRRVGRGVGKLDAARRSRRQADGAAGERRREGTGGCAYLACGGGGGVGGGAPWRDSAAAAAAAWSRRAGRSRVGLRAEARCFMAFPAGRRGLGRSRRRLSSAPPPFSARALPRDWHQRQLRRLTRTWAWGGGGGGRAG